MKLYITKPAHTKYGRIPLENPFNSIEELIDASSIWFKEPVFEKPFIDIFGDKFCWRSWGLMYICKIPFKDFPSGEVKEKIRKIINQSIDSNFYETLHNRHYKWKGEVDVELIRRKTKGNFNLYLIKPPSAWDVLYAGVDRSKIFLSKPNEESMKNEFENENIHYIEGRIFRKNKELYSLSMEMWDEIKNSFTIPEESFFPILNDGHHKDNQDPTKFIRSFFFDLKIK